MFIPLVKPILRTAALILSIIVYALTILAAYGGRFDPDFFTFPAVMTLALPWLAIASLVITVAWFCFGRIFAGGLGVLAIIASWGPVTTACPLASSSKPTLGAQTFSLMTYNILHGRDLEGKSEGLGYNRTFDYIIHSGIDIVCLQEIRGFDPKEIDRLSQTQLDTLRKVYPFIVGDPSLDMKVLSKYPVVFEKGYNYIDGSFDPKRYTFYKLNINGHRLTLINVHLMSFMLSKEDTGVLTGIRSVNDARNSISMLKGGIREKLDKGFKKRKDDVEILRRTIDRIKGPMIICGDFNDVPESYAYRLLKGEDMKDAYVETGFGPLVTYNRHAFWFHLDQIFYRDGLKALDVRKGKTRVSDHYPVIAEFEFTDPSAD